MVTNPNHTAFSNSLKTLHKTHSYLPLRPHKWSRALEPADDPPLRRHLTGDSSLFVVALLDTESTRIVSCCTGGSEERHGRDIDSSPNSICAETHLTISLLALTGISFTSLRHFQTDGHRDREQGPSVIANNSPKRGGFLLRTSISDIRRNSLRGRC